MSEPYRTVLVDLYDTFAWSDWATWQRALSGELGVDHDEVGRAFDVTRPSRSVGANVDAAADLSAVLAEIGMEVAPERLEALRVLERELIQDALHPYEDSLPVLRELRARGVRTALVSNCSHNTRPSVDRLRLEDEFDAVILSFEVGARKPDPAIYLEALRRLGAGPQGAVFVDDQAEFCDGAAAVGLDTYLIARPNPSLEGRGRHAGRHRTIEDLTALL